MIKIQDATIQSMAGPQHKLAIAKKNHGGQKKRKVSANIPVGLRSLGPLMIVHQTSGEYIGLLDSRLSKGVNQLLSLSSVRLQAFLCGQLPFQSQSPPMPASICINVYGPMQGGYKAGKILSDHGIFLQHPRFNEKHLGYKNPHYFTGCDDDHESIIKTGAPVRLLSTVEAEIKTLFEANVESSMSEVNPGNEVKTPLLR